MAILYFHRGATQPDASALGREVLMSEVLQRLAGFSGSLHPGPLASDHTKRNTLFPPHVNVVILVAADEVNERFPLAGCYWFPQLMPVKCRELLGWTDEAGDALRGSRRRFDAKSRRVAS